MSLIPLNQHAEEDRVQQCGARTGVQLGQRQAVLQGGGGPFDGQLVSLVAKWSSWDPNTC